MSYTDTHSPPAAVAADQILVVEDDEVIREALEELLQDEGYRVQTAAHGARALQLLYGGLRPAVILLDLMMPVMDGWQLLRALRLRPALSQAQIVVISAALEDETPAGTACYMEKPVRLEKLLGHVARLSGRAQPA